MRISDWNSDVCSSELNPDVPLASGSFNDSVLPVMEAGQVELVDMNHTVDTHLDDKVGMEAAHGHTKGHIAIHVKGKDGHAVMPGDIFHHPILFAEPHTNGKAAGGGNVCQNG